MKIGKFIGTALSICCFSAVHAHGQTTNLTQQILQLQTFREGLVLAGNQSPSEAENQELLEVLTHLSEPTWTAALEQFFKDHPNSPWAASLHYDYASFCRRTGRTTKALEQFEAAWSLAKNDTSPQGQRLGGTILANWTELLSTLGRLEKLKELVAVGDQWHFVNPHDRDKFQGSKHSYDLMQLHPGIAYRCGTFALKAVGGVMQPGNPALESLVEVPSPTNGFSLAGLADLAKQYGLNLVAVRRPLRAATGGQDLIVPSVVHWRQNHYAAIIGRQDDLYVVSDPTFGGQKLLSAEVINEEASGEFLIPAALATNGWAQLVRNDATAIHGMGLPDDINDGKDKCCIRTFFGQTICTHCPGMPVWWVSEPYVNLWLADEPVSYQTSTGDPFTFQVTYKQRDSMEQLTTGLVKLPAWNHSWFSCIRMQGTLVNNVDFSSCDLQLYLPNGGEVDFPPVYPVNAVNSKYDAETRLTVMPVNGRSGTWELTHSGVVSAETGSTGLQVVHPDGAVDVYGIYVVQNTLSGDVPYADLLLTRSLDAHGRTTRFLYYGGGFGELQLQYVVDPDGLTNTLQYVGGYGVYGSGLISEVDNPYGLAAKFKYDAGGNLTNITDAQGLSSCITYDTNGYPTALFTPYGTTTFSIFANSTVASTNGSEGNFGGDDLIDRAVQVTDPVGATSLHMYRYDCSSASPVDMSPTYPSSNVPTNTPLGTLDTGGGSSTNTLAGVCYRNSFYWGPRQFAGLSTTNMNSFTANDYLRGRMQHWLEDTNQLYLTGYLSVEQDASPDGSTPGLQTFYDYLGKQAGYNFCAGSYPLPSVRAWRLPNGETHSEYLQFDAFGNFTNDISTYTLLNGGVGTRTNQWIYATNQYSLWCGYYQSGGLTFVVTNQYVVENLLTQVIGPDGQTVWSGGSFDTVSWTNTLNSPLTSSTNVPVITGLRVLPDAVTNGLGQIASAFYGQADRWLGCKSFSGLTTTNYYGNPANGFLLKTIDMEIARTNSFGYGANGLVTAFTNELGLNLSFSWDNLLRPTGTGFPDGTSTSIIYDKLDPGITYDRLGNFSYYFYDGARHLTGTLNANYAENLLTWCGCGALTSVQDAAGHVTTLNYDNQGRLTGYDFPDGSSLTYQYDLAGRMTNAADGAGRSLSAAYNNQGLVTNVTDALGHSWSRTTYDVRDRVVASTDANNVTVTNTFDLLDRVLTKTWPDGIGEGYGYSAQGLAFYTNRDQQVTRYGRNAAGWLLAMTNANGEVNQVTRDPAGDVVSLLDGLNHTTSWQYNQYGWLTNKVDGLGRNAFRYAYNADGWRTSRWTPEKGSTSYTYDNVGNLTATVYPQLTITCAYDLLNELTNMVDAVGTTAFGYTPVGTLASENGPWANDTVSNSYTQGLRTLLTIAQSGTNWTQSYAYDAGWRLTNTVSMAGSFIYNFQSALLNSPSSILLPNGAYITNSFDPLARLTQTALVNHWGHTLDGYAYTPDALGLRTNIVRNLGLTSSSVNAGFDKIGQIISWNAAESGGLPRQNEQLNFVYDAADNLHARTNGALSQMFNVDAANELTGVTRNGTFTLAGAMPAPATNIIVNGVTAQTYGDFTFARTNLTLANGNNTFTNVARNIYGFMVTNIFTVNLPSSVSLNYDGNGNLTNDGTKFYGFDAENQMTNVMVAGQWRSDYVYDGLNRRRITRDYAWNGSAWVKTNETRLIYDGYQIIQERDTNNNVLVSYTRGLDLSGTLNGAGGIGGLLARTDTNGSTFYHADGAGNITALMDGYENIVGRYQYGAFGGMNGMWGKLAPVNVMHFSSMPEYHAGIVGFAGRFWLTYPQRWANNDLAQEFGGINLTRGMRNNPLSYIDPTGKAPQLVGVSFDFNTGRGTGTYEDHQFGDDYGIGFNNPPGGSIFAAATIAGGVANAIDNAWNAGLDRITPAIDPNQNPYAYAASQTARELALGGLTTALGGELGKLFNGGKVSCPIARAGTPTLGSLTPSQAKTIQAFADRFGAEVNVVGSRAAGTAGPLSDFDYVIGGNASLRNSASYYLPSGAAGGEINASGIETGIDIFNANRTPLDPTRPFIQFTPRQTPVVGPR